MIKLLGRSYMMDKIEDFWDTIAFRYEDAISYLRNRFINKHYIINTGLNKGGYYDTDTKMLYGMMGLLMDYIEKEKPFEHIDWEENEASHFTKIEILAIRDWWVNYPNRQKEIKNTLHAWSVSKNIEGDDWLDKLNLPDTPKTKALMKKLDDMESKLNSEEQDMLIRLIKIRRYLWT